METWIIDKIHLDREIKNIDYYEIPLKTNIPLFHRSIIPCVRQKDQASKNYYNFSKLYNFQDV